MQGITSYAFCFTIHLKFKKCTDRRREILKRSNINTVIDAFTATTVSKPSKFDTKKLFTNYSVCYKFLQVPSVSNESNSCITSDYHICKNKRNCNIFSVKSNSFMYSYCYEFDKDQDSYDSILNQNLPDKIITTSEVSIKQNGTGNSENNVMLESNDRNLAIPLQQKNGVRKIIEDLIASMLGGSLDNVFVGQLFKNLEYLKIFLLFHSELSKIIHNLEVSFHQTLTSDLPISEHEPNPNLSYENLRKIVQTIVYEVIKLPEFHNQRGFSNVDVTQTQSSFEPKEYEDLLATAVINKIVETYSDRKCENSSGVHSAGSDLDSTFNAERINNNFILNPRSITNDFKTEYSAFNERIESTSMKTSAIIDEIFREKLGEAKRHSSVTSTISTRSELSDYIRNHRISLPDLEFRQTFFVGSEDSDDIVPDLQSPYTDNSDIQAICSHISDNWLFLKPLGNRLKYSTSNIVSATAPVGMLVPSPTEDCRTLIGDRNADEISDLSEAGSDSESVTDDNDIINSRAVDIDKNVNHSHNAYDLKHVLLESKTLIGGKNEMGSFEKNKGSFIELLEPDSLVSVQSLNDQSPAISEAKNNLILIGERINYQNDCLTYKIDSSINTELKMGEYIGLDSNESLINFDSLKLDNTNNENYKDSMQDSRNTKPIPAIRKTDENKNRFAGSIAEREHMKWQNAVELRNNPYSAEALQRRLSQTQKQFIDGLTRSKNIETVDETTIKINRTNPPSDVKSVLESTKFNSERYGRDYYINDSKTASGSREQRTCGDLNLHRAINYANENDSDSFVIGDFQVVSNSNPIDTSRELRKNKVKIISTEAEKLDHLCIVDREYYLLKTEAIAIDEYTKLSLSSENTDDSDVTPLSLNRCDDSLLTIVSDESECATAVHVYNLSKRETKVLRHDIIKRSRIPIGGDLKYPTDSLGNCCGSTNDHKSQDDSTSELGSTIKDFSNHMFETIKTDETKSIRSAVQLKSVYLNHSPHTIKMDIQKNAPGTKDAKDSNELLLNDNYSQAMAENIEIDAIAATKKLIEFERNNVFAESDCDTQKMHEYVKNNDTGYTTYPSKKFEQSKINKYNFLSEERKADYDFSTDPIIEANIEVSDASELSEDISSKKPTKELHPFKNVQVYKRNFDITVQVGDHKEKSVIEEDVISLLPSVRALAQTFSQHVHKDVLKQRPTVRLSFNGNDENTETTISAIESFVPRFNHSYNPISPGYSITARSLSNKFREELRNSTGGKTGRLTPERPSSPVLVPGILKNNVAFFEKLRNQ